MASSATQRCGSGGAKKRSSNRLSFSIFDVPLRVPAFASHLHVATSAAPVAEALHAAGLPYVVTSGYDPVELARLGFDAPVLRKPYLKSEVGQALAGWSCPG